jgi:SAM-dependent methyltransferase
MSRTPERLRHHYEVEKELASRLRASTREERPALFKELYNELFERVPDHPRLTRRESPEESRRKVDGQLRLLRPFLRPEKTLVEFAPGDCRLGYAASGLTHRVIGVDISDQRALGEPGPANFELVVYDGYVLPLPDGIADVAFSYQFLEHLHPDDVAPHLTQVRRLLKPGGWYVFDTPHRFSGPHDISSAFGTELVGFHFQEWTYSDMIPLLRSAGFATATPIKRGKALSPLTARLLFTLETLIGSLPAAPRRSLAQRLFQSVTLAAHVPPAS